MVFGEHHSVIMVSWLTLMSARCAARCPGS